MADDNKCECKGTPFLIWLFIILLLLDSCAHTDTLSQIKDQLDKIESKLDK